MKKFLPYILGLLILPAIAFAQSIPTVSPFVVDVSGNITQRIASTPFKLTGISDGCANFTSGILGSTGSACGSGGGGSSTFGTSSLSAIYPLIYTQSASLAQFSIGFSTTTQNFWNKYNNFSSLFASSASSTNATTTNLSITAITSHLLKTNSEGDVVAAILGTDFVNGSGVSGNCVMWGASNALADTGSPCGSGTGGVTSLAGTANQITASASTGAVTLSLPNHVIFPVDFLATNSSTTNATTTGAVYFSALSIGGLAIDANHKVYSAATTTAGTGLAYSGNAFNVNATQNITTLSNLASGVVNTNSGVLYNTATSTPGVTSPIGYTGTLGQFIGGVSGNFTCTTCVLTSRNINTTFPLQGGGALSGDLTLTNSFSTTTNTGMAQGNLYVGSGGIFQTSASSSIFGFTPASNAVTVTLAGTANQITSSNSSAQALTGNVSTTFTLPSHVIFPGDFLSPAGSTTNATTTGSQYFTGITASRPLYVDSTGKLTSAGTGTSGNCVNWQANNTFGDAGSACGSGGGGTSAQASTTASFIVYKAGTTYYAYNASTTVVTSNADFSTLLQATVNTMGGSNGLGQGGKIFFQPGIYYANSTTTSSGNDQASTLNSPAIQFQGSGQESTEIVVASNTTFLQFNHIAIPTVSDLSCYYKGGGSCIAAISTGANTRSIYQFDFHNLFFGATTTVTTPPLILNNVLRGTINNVEFFGVHGCAAIGAQGNFNAGDFVWTHSFCETDATAGAIALNFSTSTGATGWVNQVHFTQFDAIADGTGATYIKGNPLLWSTFDDMGVEQFDTFVDSGNGFDVVGNAFNFKYMTPRNAAGLTMFKMVAGAQGNSFTFGDLNSPQSIVVINDANGNTGDPDMISGYIGQDAGTASVVNSGGSLVVRDIKGYGTMDSTLEPGGVAMPFGVPGWLGIATSSPGTQFSIGTTNGINITSSGTSTFGTAANGINLNAGCFAIQGTCVGGGSGSSFAYPFTASTYGVTNVFSTTTPFLDYQGIIAATSTFGTITATSTIIDKALTGTGFRCVDSTSVGALANTTTDCGSVSSVAMTVPAFLSIGGSPITTSGTLALTLSGTALPQANGGTGATSIGANMILANNGSSVVVSTSTPTAAAYLATSTTATSTFQGGFEVGTTTQATGGTNNAMVTVSNFTQAIGGILINTWTNVTNAFSVVNAAGAKVFGIDTTATVPLWAVGTSSGAVAQADIVGLFGVPPINNTYFQIASSSQNSTTTLFKINNVGDIILTGDSTMKPTLGSCGTSPSISATSTDVRGTVTTGSGSPTACNITFAHVKADTPTCVISDGSTAVTIDIAAASTTGVQFAMSAALNTTNIYYICIQ